MIGGLIKSNRFAALTGSVLLAGGLAVSPAQAADFGGDCCADLEERVAVLEATTARKGNRKVSLTISGYVTQQIMVWDDGTDSDAYVGTALDDLTSRLTFAGSAKINSEWSAGYSIYFSIETDNLFQVTQNDDDGGGGVEIENNLFWIKSEQLGKISLGRMNHATDNIPITDLSGLGSIFAANVVIFDGASFFLRANGANLTTGGADPTNLNWSTISHCHAVNAGIFGDCSGDRTDSVRYDSPTIAGFVFSASWGEDDLYDVALRYAGEFGDIKVAAAFGYTVRSGDSGVGTAGINNQARSELVQGAISIMHTPTGLFVSANGMIDQLDIAGQPDAENFWVKAGIRQRWNSLGATVLYGEYAVGDDQYANGATLAGDLITATEFTRYGLGIVQEIDAASMSIWAKWRHHEGEITAAGATTDLDELDMFLVGGVIFF